MKQSRMRRGRSDASGEVSGVSASAPGTFVPSHLSRALLRMRAPPYRCHIRRGSARNPHDLDDWSAAVVRSAPGRKESSLMKHAVRKYLPGVLLAGMSLLIVVAYASTALADDNVCAGLSGDAAGLCNAYCRRLDCPEGHPGQACQSLLANWRAATGLPAFPCDAVCCQCPAPAGPMCTTVRRCLANQQCQITGVCKDGRCPPPPPSCSGQDANTCAEGTCPPGDLCVQNHDTSLPACVCAPKCAANLCGGACPTLADGTQLVCHQSSPTAAFQPGCACVRPGCGVNDPTCRNACDNGGKCTSTATGCQCLLPDCEEASAPACNASCPPGMTCTNITTGANAGCHCAVLDCTTTDPFTGQCDGFCGGSGKCMQVPGTTNNCQCVQPCEQGTCGDSCIDPNGNPGLCQSATPSDPTSPCTSCLPPPPCAQGICGVNCGVDSANNPEFCQPDPTLPSGSPCTSCLPRPEPCAQGICGINCGVDSAGNPEFCQPDPTLPSGPCTSCLPRPAPPCTAGICGDGCIDSNGNSGLCQPDPSLPAGPCTFCLPPPCTSATCGQNCTLSDGSQGTCAPVSGTTACECVPNCGPVPGSTGDQCNAGFCPVGLVCALGPNGCGCQAQP
jgi:hypothetical protein